MYVNFHTPTMKTQSLTMAIRPTQPQDVSEQPASILGFLLEYKCLPVSITMFTI